LFVIVSKANHNKRICGHNNHNNAISSVDVMKEEKNGKKRELQFLFLGRYQSLSLSRTSHHSSSEAVLVI
jgi:hypothetical protein